MSEEPEASVVSLAERRAEAEAREAEARRQQARAQTKVDPSELPKPWLTYTLLGINLLVWLVMVGLGVDPWEPSGSALRDWGGNLGILTSSGQWWRLLTAMFLHAGILHLAFNLYFLWVVGRVCEQIFRPGAYAVVYFGSGLIASLVSVAWQPAIVSVGASGALFGVFGAFLGFTIRRRDMLPEAFVRSVRRNALILIGVNLAIGIGIPGIDVAAHVGGLVAGLGLGYLIAKLAERQVANLREARAVRLRAITAAACAAVLVLAAGVLAIPRWDNPFPVLDDAQDTYKQVIDAYLAAGDDGQARALVLEHEAIPAMQRVIVELGGFDRLPELARETVDRQLRYYELRKQAFETELDGIRNNDARALARAEDLHAEAVAVAGGED